MNRDIKFLLGLVPWVVTFVLWSVGLGGSLSIKVGFGLALLYVLIAVQQKFYNDPPKHMLHAYRDLFGMNGLVFLFLLDV